jgi:endo-1,4-beta-xylanase
VVLFTISKFYLPLNANKMYKTFLTITVLLAFFSCQKLEKEEPTLKSAYSGDFLIGSALGTTHINGTIPEANELIKNQFAVYTPENVMKSQEIHPGWDEYNFDLADKLIALGEKNNVPVVGHTLIWHSQLSPFITKNISPDSLKLFMKNHISTVAGRYNGKILGWDVVNEALNEDGTLRKSIFLEKLGEQYLIDAFKLAQEAAPSAELYYNDYNNEQPKKREGTIKLVKMLQAAGAKIDGVGIQGHWSINGLPLKEIEESIIAYHELGLKVMFTELDITVLPNPWDLKGAEVSQNFEGSPFMNPYPDGLPDDVSQKLANSYESLFKLFLKHKDKVSRVTFWGVNDGHTWLNNWPIKGRTNYPLLFDRNYQPKKAYQAVMGLKATK